MSKCILISLILLSIYGCSTSDNSSPDGFKLDNIPPDTIKGHFSSGWELSIFIPCNSDESWSISSGTSQFSSIYGSIASDTESRVFIQAKGSVSELGQYGHLGINKRIFNLTNLYEMRKPLDDDCSNIPFNFESFSSTVNYDGLTVYLNTYIDISAVNGPDPALGYKAEIKMASLEGVTPNASISNIELSVLRNNAILWSANPYGGTIPPDENFVSFLFKSEPLSTLFEDGITSAAFENVDVIFKFIYEDEEVVIKQKEIPVNF